MNNKSFLEELNDAEYESLTSQEKFYLSIGFTEADKRPSAISRYFMVGVVGVGGC